MRKLLLLLTTSVMAVSVQAQLSWGTQIGQTYYDLQSNQAASNCFVQNADGTMSATWIEHWDYLTTANEPKPAVRGFGYNHYDPASGGWVHGSDGECWQDPFGCASSYIGWPNIINNPGGSGMDEIIISHTPLKMTSRSTINTGVWGNTTTIGIEANMGNGVWDGTWPRAVSSGNYIHLIATSTDPTDTGLFDGSDVERPPVYFRSSDGGQTWDITNYSFGIDTAEIREIGADAYAMHANGSTVAVTFGGGPDNDWLMYKSTNNGTSWTKYVVKNNHNLPVEFAGQGGNDGVITNNEHFDILVDDNGRVHVFSAMSMTDGEFIYADAQLYKSAGAGIMYWNDGMAQNTASVIAYPDYGHDGDTSNYSIYGGEFYGTFFAMHPSASFDASGNLYLLYSSIVENTLYVNPLTQDSIGYNDLYMVFSLDNGNTWCRTDDPINIAAEIAGIAGGTSTQDDVFPMAVPEVLNGNLDFIWQGDWSAPGLALYEDTHPNDNLNYIHHYRMDVSSLSSCASVPGQGATGPVLNVSNTTGTSCYGNTDGTATVFGTGGDGNYQYSSDGTNFTTSTTLTGLPGGTVTLYIRDGTGWVTSTTVTISQPAQIVIGGVSTTNSSCGNADGSLTVSGSGGTGSYTYSIDGTNYQASGTFTGLAAGSYTVYIKDASNCVGTGTVSVVDAAAPSASITNVNDVSCNGSTDGSVTLQASGGSGGYTYSIDGVNFQGSNAFTSLAAGNYVATVQDNAGCIVTVSFTITEPSAILFGSVTANNATCGVNDGSIVASASGGTGTIQFSIDGSSYQTSGTFSNLSTGNYTVYARDINGCVTTFATSITNQGAPSVNVNGKQVVCVGESSQITVSPTGGTSPYQYSLDGTTYQSGNVFNLGAGTYTFYVRDNAGCVAFQSGFSIAEDICDGISEMADLQISVYPNPSTGVYNLQLKNQLSNTIDASVYDFLGQQVANFNVNRNDDMQQINLSDQPKGVYFLQLTSSGGGKRTVKLIKH